MKKSRKYGLIAGGVAIGVIAGVALAFSGYNTGRMPTLPTPTGVVVPPGMRYVGGDEFGSAKPAGDSSGEITRADGVMSMKPVWDEGARKGRVTGAGWTSADKVNFDIPGRIEVRMAFHPAADSQVSIGNTAALGWFSIQNNSAPMEIWNAFESRKYDEGFHTYALEWDNAGFRFLRDGLVEPVPELHAKFLMFMTAKPVVSNAIRRRMPASLVNFTDRWRTTDEAAKHSPVMIMLVSKNPDAEIPRADFDYVRIFQE